MPRISGIYNLPASYKATSGQTIKTEQHNPPFEDVAKALTESLPRDGSAPMTGNLPMNGKKITGIGEGTADGDAVRRDQVTLYSAWLSAVADLSMDANKLPYATGAGSAELTALTAFARSLLDDADAETARETLGLGAAATRAIEETLTDGENLPTGAAVTAYVDAQPLSGFFKSTGNEIPAAGVPLSKAHGLGATPNLYTVSLVCASADLGYAVGEEISLAAHEGNGTRALSHWSAPNSIGFIYSSGIYIANRSASGAVSPIDTAKWRLTYRAWA